MDVVFKLTLLQFAFVKFEFYIINNQAIISVSNTYAAAFDKDCFLKEALQRSNCLMWFKGFEMEEERIDVCAASP